MKILLTGRDGQLGWELRRTLGAMGDVVAPGRAEMDLADPDAILRVTRDLCPDLIVNAAAWTEVDAAESDAARALAINARAPGILAEEAKRLGAALVHYSTDYVFDGGQPGPYVESDRAAPLSVYGESKLEGERAVAAAGCPHLILRTSWVYGGRGRNFLLTMLRLLAERPEVGVVNDRTGVPSWSRWVAEATAFMLAARGKHDLPVADAIYHLVPSGEASWFDFALAIRDRMACPGRVRAIPATDYPTPARRPQSVVLACTKVETEFGLYRPHWRELLELCLEDMQR